MQQASLLEGKLDVERYVEDPHIVDQHHHYSQGDPQFCPLLAGNVQLLGRDNVGDVSGNQHEN